MRTLQRFFTSTLAMIIPSLRPLCLTVLFSLAFTAGSNAQQHASNTKSPEVLLPLDTAVRMGRLANGFTYYIQHNATPEKRVYMSLVVKAGSVLEEEDQRGLAHYLEHMAFNGTKHFPKHELISYLQKNGVRFGSDLNAYTSFNSTVYQLPLPSDDPAVLANGYQILRDWAQEISLEQSEIDKERGVILEERRIGMGLNWRLREQTLPLTLNHSRYAARLPIGIEKVLNTFPRSRIIDFYRDWYRPDLQAIVIVGDIGVDETEKQIRQLFSDLKNPRKEKKRPNYAIPLTGKNQYLIVTDGEQPNTVLELNIKHEARRPTTTAALRRDIVISLFNSIVRERVSELTKREPSILEATVGIGPLFHNLDRLSLRVAPKQGELESAFKVLLAELIRYSQNGFGDAALKRAKARYASLWEREFNERSNTPSSEFAGRYDAHFTDSTASPGVGYQYGFIKENLEKIRASDLDEVLKEYFASTNRDIIVIAPENETASLPNQTTLERWIDEVSARKLSPINETESDHALMDNLPTAGKVVDQREHADVGITELTLSNGVKVVLKPTIFRNDEILIEGFSPGGTSRYENKDYMSAALAADIVGASGVGDFDSRQLKNILNGKQAIAHPYISERFEGIRAAATKGDLETALQLIYLYMTSPRKDSTVFETFLRRQKAALQNRDNTPDNIFNDTISAVLGAHHYRRSAPSLAKLNTINLDNLYSIYRDRFADASDFTFVLVGSFKVETLIPMLEKYLGSLPGTNRHEAAVDLGIRVPRGTIVRTVFQGRENKATVHLVYSGSHVYNQRNNLQLDGLKEVLQLRLTERLREEEGGVYSPTVSVSYSKYPVQSFTLIVSFDCSPANVNKLVQLAQSEIEMLKEKGVQPEDVQKYLASRRRQWQTMQVDNEFWFSFLTNTYMENESTGKVLTYIPELERVTPSSLQKAALEHFDSTNVIKFFLLPSTALENK